MKNVKYLYQEEEYPVQIFFKLKINFFEVGRKKSEDFEEEKEQEEVKIANNNSDSENVIKEVEVAEEKEMQSFSDSNPIGYDMKNELNLS